MTFTTSQIDELVAGAAAAIGPGDITWIKPRTKRSWRRRIRIVRAFLDREPSNLFAGIAAASVITIVGTVMVALS